MHTESSSHREGKGREFQLEEPHVQRPCVKRHVRGATQRNSEMCTHVRFTPALVPVEKNMLVAKPCAGVRGGGWLI